MPELIDKKRTEAKVFLIARLFIDRPDREIELVKAVIHRCCEEIDKQPAIEPEVRHGRWVPQESGRYKCSRCGHEVEITVSELVDPRDYGCYLDDYCGGCGAKMYADGETISKERFAEIMGGADNGRCN